MLNVSSAFLSAIKQGSRTVSASIGYDDKALTNKVSNGDFSNGLTSWLASGGTHTVANKELTFTATAQYGGDTQGIASAIGNKVYYRAMIKADSTMVNLKLMDSTNYNTIYISTVGSYTLVSGIMTPALTASLTFKIQDDRASGWTPIKVKECVVLDLTALYGAGSEPSKSYMDALFARVGFFSGTKNVPLKFLGDRVLTNGLTNGNFATSTTGWAGSNSSTIARQTTSPTGNFPSGVTQCVADTIVTGQTTGYNTQGLTLIPNHTYYISGWVYVPSTAVGTASLSTWYVNGGWQGLKSINITERDTWVYKSMTFTPNSTYPSSIVGFGLSGTTVGSVSYTANFTLLDLSLLYGLGSEPTQATVDTLMGTTGWFQTEPLLEDASILCNFNIDSALGNGNLPSIGATISNKLTFELINDATIPQVLIGKTFRPFVAVDVTGTGSYEWVKLGEFYADYDGIDIGKLQTTIEAFDEMASYMEMKYTAMSGLTMTVQGVLNDLSTNYGVAVDPNINKNLFDTKGYVTTINSSSLVALNGDGVTIVANTFPYTSCPTYNLKANTTYTISFGSVTGSSRVQLYRVSDGTALVDTGYQTALSYTFTTVADTSYKVKLHGANASVLKQIQIEESTFPTFYMRNNATADTLISTPMGSVRQVLSCMASCMSTNATIDANGYVKFMFNNTIDAGTFSLGLDNYSDFKLQPDSIVNFTELILTEGNNQMPWGDTSGYALSFANEQVATITDVQDIYNRIFPFSYYAYTMKCQGMPHLELGDVVYFTYLELDGSQNTIPIPIIKHKFTFNGGFVSEFSASAPQQSTTSVTVTSGSSVADAIDVTYTDLNDAIAMANKQITGNQGGYVTTILNANNQPQEIVISNTPDCQTADKVWRWNASGLGFGASYNLANSATNPTAVALTADGSINATRMTTGVLTADIIKAGKLQDKTNQSWIDMTNGQFSFGGGKLAWNGSALTINYAGTQLATDMGLKADASRVVPFETNISFTNGIITLGKTGNPFSVNITNQAMEFIDKGTTGGVLNLTAITGSGSAITCTYPAQTSIPYQVGGYIQIAGCSVGAYNGTWLVTSCTTTQVVATCTATGTVSSGFGTIQYGSSPNTVAYINGQKMYISDLQTTNSIQVGLHQMTKDTVNSITLIKYAG